MQTVKQVYGGWAQRPGRKPEGTRGRRSAPGLQLHSRRGAGCVRVSQAPAARGRDAWPWAAGARGPCSAVRPWLPDAAALVRVHVGALGAVEGVREGRQVLQRAQHPEGDQGPEPASLGARGGGRGLPAGRRGLPAGRQGLLACTSGGCGRRS